MGKVSLLDVAGGQGPDPNAATTTQGMGQGTGDFSGAGGAKYSILTNPDQVFQFTERNCKKAIYVTQFCSHPQITKKDSTAVHYLQVLEPCSQGERRQCSPHCCICLRSSVPYLYIQNPQAGDEELCIRFTPLSVLVYEAIVEEILSYDYAPQPRCICYEVEPIS